MFEKFIKLVLRRPGLILCIALIASFPMLRWSAALFGDLRANLKELLPEGARSVQTLRELERRFGGFSQLSILVTSPDKEANRRFSDDLVKALSGHEFIRSIRNKLGEDRAFVEKRAWLYIDLEDLEDARERIENAANDARARANPLLVDLEDKSPVTLDFSDLEKKYSDRTGLGSRFPNGYFESKDGTDLVVLIRQRGFAFTISRNKQLLAVVEAAINGLNPKSYNPSMEIGLAADVKNLVDEQQTLIEDLVTASVIVFFLLSLVVLLYYRRPRAILLLAAPVFVGTVFTFGVGHFLVGYLNASSAFLGPIIPGNGINFGVILLARYMEARREGVSLEGSTAIAMRDSMKGTLSAALAASIAYGSLMATDFLGFKHFGIIGGVGMLLCWAATFTVLPAFILVIERRWPTAHPKEGGYRPGALARFPAELVRKHPRAVAWCGLATFITSLVVTALFLRDPFEKNFDKLRSTDTHARGAAYWGKRVDAVFDRYLSPQVVLAEKPEDVPAIVDYLKKVIKEGGENAPLSDVTALDDFVPRDQDAKLKVLADIRKLLTDDLLANLSEKQREQAKKIRPPEDLAAFTVKDLPDSLRADFREIDGREGLVVLALPNHKLNLYHADEIKRVSDVLRSIPLPDGRRVESSGNFVVYSDMVDAVGRDGPRATAYSFIGVLALCVLMFRRMSRVAVVVSGLLLGVAWLGAGFVLFSLKINFLNFIALPITFGIGVDYAVNIFSRYRIEREKKERHEAAYAAVVSTGGAVALCSLTTVIGYASLIVARNGALISFGQVAILGEITTLVAALVVMPAWLLAWSREA